MKYLLAIFMLLLLTACAMQPPGPSAANVPLTLKAAREAPDTAIGKRIRWGGSIVSVINQPQQTRLEIVSRPLRANGRPRENDDTDGRFLAIVEGFLDPMVYAKGRQITINGVVQGVERGKIGEYPYQFIVVKATSHTLWKQQKPVDVRYVPDPLYGWHPARWGYPYPPYWW